MGGFVSEIQLVPGQPATVRTGRVESINPLVVSIQGATLQASAVGVLESYVPAVSDSVLVVGQSKTTGSDPSSWVVLGRPVPSSSVTVPPDSPAVSAFSSAANSSTSAVFAPGAPIIGVAFTTNAAGTFLVSWRSGLDNTLADTKGVVGWEVRLGAVVGSGAVQIAAGPNMVIGMLNVNEMEMGATSEVQTLLPSTVYNIQLMFARQVGTGTAAFARSGVTVLPV